MPRFNPRVYDGANGDISNKRIVVAVSSYHRSITEKLLAGALATLERSGANQDHVLVLWVAGAWELAVAARRVINQVDALICLGAVIRGETSHDQHINSMVSGALGRIGVDSAKPVAFGVLTCDSVAQAIERSGGRVGNKGEEAAMAAVQMLRLFDQIGDP